MDFGGHLELSKIKLLVVFSPDHNVRYDSCFIAVCLILFEKMRNILIRIMSLEFINLGGRVHSRPYKIKSLYPNAKFFISN